MDLPLSSKDKTAVDNTYDDYSRVFPSENPRFFSLFSLPAKILSDFTPQLIIAETL